jgi:SAM-dependent methyltransferase
MAVTAGLRHSRIPQPNQPGAWHAWFTQQARWTRPTRRWLYREARLAQVKEILEVGCGTGVITNELAQVGTARAVGLDIDTQMLVFAGHQGSVTYIQGDAHALPFPDGSFDAIVCHYLLLWLTDPVQGVREMARVVRPTGCVLACAEPDYGGRIDHPAELVDLGQRQAEALRGQGANPEIGRRLGEIFTAAGLRAVVGTMAGQWSVPAKPDDAPDGEFEAEWAMRERDLSGSMPAEELDRLRALDRQALAEGRRMLFVPTFYALGCRAAGHSN